MPWRDNDLENINIERIIYRGIQTKMNSPNLSIVPVGVDTEAYTTGKMFMIGTSYGDIFKPEEFPACFFTAKYRGTDFVSYNLKYEEGAFLQHLPADVLNILWKKQHCEHEGYSYSSIPKKLLTISKGKNAIRFWDMASFFGTSLDKAAQTFLGKQKIEVETKSFTPEYVKENYTLLSEYCIYDAILVRDLAQALISKFEQFGVYPRKLFSTAYISLEYFRNKCNMPTVKRFYDNQPELLTYAMQSYNGGKFEVTTKGFDTYYEYDINSAYPYEIANLLDTDFATVTKSSSYNHNAQYGFIKCKVNIQKDIYSPVAVKEGYTNIYPIGYYTKVLTKAEFDYLQSLGAKLEIINAYWLTFPIKRYPYKEQIELLYKTKSDLKKSGDTITYHLVKIFLNSLYGKFCQLIETEDKYRAGPAWHPIYASIITANTRIRVSQLQNKYPSIVAVFTDSVISTEPLPIPLSKELGAWDKAEQGEGVILGSGVYQIGDKVKFRGFETREKLTDLITNVKDGITITKRRPLSWREIVAHGWDTDTINEFKEIERKLNINFDHKRIWLEDYKTFLEVASRKVYSAPRIRTLRGWLL